MLILPLCSTPRPLTMPTLPPLKAGIDDSPPVINTVAPSPPPLDPGETTIEPAEALSLDPVRISTFPVSAPTESPEVIKTSPEAVDSEASAISDQDDELTRISPLFSTVFPKTENLRPCACNAAIVSSTRLVLST